MKGVAVGYIIAIVLGIVILGVIGYWLFISSGKIGGSATVQDCKQRQLLLCTQWAQGGYPDVTDDTTEATEAKLPGYNKWNTECGPIPLSINRGTCKKLLGLS